MRRELHARWSAPGGRFTRTYINFGSLFLGAVMDQFRLRCGWPGLVALWIEETEGCERRVIATWPERAPQ